MADYLISIIMPTYQSEKTIEYSLKSIRGQSIDQNLIEILVLDGGSTDNTLMIAKKYGTRIILNNKRLPEVAKQIGLMEASGKYGIFIDSDEAFINKDSIKKRLEYLTKYPEVKNLVSTGQVCQASENGVTRYANYIGDPFSNFVYRFNGYNRIEDLTRQYKFSDIGDGFLLDFKNCGYLPLFDALGNMFDIEAARRIYENTGKSESYAANIFSNMVQQTKCAIIMKNDFVCHRSGLDRKRYLNKLRWRVKNNLFSTEGVGFTQRNQSESGLSIRKYLFVFYCLLIVPVLSDSIRISLKNKDVYFLNHFWYTEYTFLMIVSYVVLKIFHYPVKLGRSYGV